MSPRWPMKKGYRTTTVQWSREALAAWSQRCGVVLYEKCLMPGFKNHKAYNDLAASKKMWGRHMACIKKNREGRRTATANTPQAICDQCIMKHLRRPHSLLAFTSRNLISWIICNVSFETTTTASHKTARYSKVTSTNSRPQIRMATIQRQNDI